jgi:hypothetical protein
MIIPHIIGLAPISLDRIEAFRIIGFHLVFGAFNYYSKTLSNIIPGRDSKKGTRPIINLFLMECTIEQVLIFYPANKRAIKRPSPLLPSGEALKECF